MKCKYVVSLYGCDDGDTVFEMELTDEEYKTVKRVSDLSKETAGYRNTPILELRKEQP